jgi:hypothetical protein
VAMMRVRHESPGESLWVMGRASEVMGRASEVMGRASEGMGNASPCLDRASPSLEIGSEDVERRILSLKMNPEDVFRAFDGLGSSGGVLHQASQVLERLNASLVPLSLRVCGSKSVVDGASQDMGRASEDMGRATDVPGRASQVLR